MLRVAIVYDNTHRPETTGTYCRRALGQLVTAGRIAAVEHILPTEADQLSGDLFDLCLCIDDGLDDDLPRLSIPVVWWAIDTHLSFDRCLKKARQADLVFAAQKNGADKLLQAGIASAQWLPLACDPEIHGRRDVGNQFDIAFVGNFFPGERQDLLQLIRQHFPRSFLGQQHYLQMAETYSAASIVFNRSLRDDINMRVFEGLCSGSLLITNDLGSNGQEELFQSGEHLLTYRSAGELLEKLCFSLEHADERERIAAAGRERVLRQHTYRHRMERILETFASMRGKKPLSLVNGHLSSAIEAKRMDVFSKSSSYFEHARPDVLELVPASAQRVLDVGCGGGNLGAAIQARQGAQVTGIELNSQAVDAASQRLDEVIVGDIQSAAIEFPPGTFDCIICADILEHLRDPLTVLRKLRRWLTPNGTLVTSIPNIRNHTVIRSLLAGNWTYEAAGLLDDDHVRFFTRREIEKLLFRAGFDVRELRMVGGDGFQSWLQQGSPRQLQLGPFQLHAASQEEAAEFFAYQYLTTATPAAAPEFGLTSIVLVTHNQWPHTQACLESIRLRTDLPYELIVVDNGSTDGTPQYLHQRDDVRVIANPDNRGFPAAVNQGILVSRGEQVLSLNNDTVVTTGWLERLLAALHSAPDIGLVGPVTNNISGEQQVPVSYDDLSQLDGFAWDWGKAQKGQLHETDRLVGFCLLIKKEVVDAIGLFDERFGIGNFEDDDYCRRALQSGYRCVIAREAFIHHVGSATFRSSDVDFGKLLQENQRLYQQKWSAAAKHEQNVHHGGTEARRENVEKTTECPNPDRQCRSSEFEQGTTPLQNSPCLSASVVSACQTIPRGSRCRPKFLLDVNERGELLLCPNDVKLSACLIVRDNEHTIRPCLESLRPWVDEIIVVDTGSLDRTPQICEELGARVLHSPWQDSFSQARNVSLSLARGEWIFWMDSDDTLPQHCGRQLRELVQGQHNENILGYIAQVHCPGETPNDVTVVDHVKLIRNRPDLRFEFHIHEQILPAIRRAGGDVAWTDLYVVHSGSDKTPQGRARKLERDFRLLSLDLQSHPDHPFVLFNLGMTYADAGQHDQAVQHLQRCIAVSAPQESHLRKAYALLIGSLMQLRKVDEAHRCCTNSLRLFPQDKELLFRQAMLQHQTGHLEAAAATYHRLLEEHEDRHFTSVDVGLAGHKARHNLAIVYEDLGERGKARSQWIQILRERPDYVPAVSALEQIQIYDCRVGSEVERSAVSKQYG